MGRTVSRLHAQGGLSHHAARSLAPLRLSVSILAMSLMTIAAVAHADSQTEKKTFGFVFSDLQGLGYNNGAGDCPDGLTVSPLDLYLETVSPAERDRIAHLSMAELHDQIYSKIPGSGDNIIFAFENGYAAGHDHCTAPLDYPDNPSRHPIFQGPISYGMNLDGSDGSKPAPNTCAHQKFTGPNGEKGVDNQLYRVTGCESARRGKVTTAELNAKAASAPQRPVSAGFFQSTYMLEIKAADLQNDADVQVAIYSSLERAPANTSGYLLRNASLHVLNDPEFMNVAQGKIVNGILTTEPADLRILPHQGYTSMSEQYFHGARLRVEFRPDGTIRGMLAGYEDVDNYYKHVVEGGGFTNENNTGYTCIGVYKALHEYADGYPDPKTGKCTGISAAYGISGVPAFIVHPQDEITSPQLSQAETPRADDKVARWLKTLSW